MNGGLGDDLYIVGDLGDVAAEADGGGYDRVRSTVDHTLGAGIEALELSGSAHLAGTGNGQANHLRGTSGNNQLAGLDGADTLLGEAGNDQLTGGLGNDQLTGGSGADTLEGGAGADTLNGGLGADAFLFATAGEGRDFVVSYVAADDQVLVSASGFGGGLEVGMDLVATGRFVSGAGVVATPGETDGQFLFNTTTRILSFDADGSGVGAAQEIAQFWGVIINGTEITVIA
jgi:Ca2+-binding RTX toxin-like protein